jgi:hypothetical protein
VSCLLLPPLAQLCLHKGEMVRQAIEISFYISIGFEKDQEDPYADNARTESTEHSGAHKY